MFRSPAAVKLQSPNPLDKPVLDPETFQQLLAAAYTMQEQNSRLLAKEAKPDLRQTLSGHSVCEAPPVSLLPVAFIGESQLQLEMDAQSPNLAAEILAADAFKPQGSRATQVMLARAVPRAVRRAVRSSGYKVERRRIGRDNQLIWRAATVVATTAVLALLLVASSDRFSPLPDGVTLPLGMVQQPVPFQEPTSPPTAPARNTRLNTTPVLIEPQVMAKPGLNEQTLVADELIEEDANPSAQKAVVNPNRVHSAYESEADVVAENTIVRYAARPAAPRVRAQKP